MDEYDNYIDFQLEDPSMNYLKKKYGTSGFEDTPPLDPATDDLPTFLAHFQVLAHAMGITRK